MSFPRGYPPGVFVHYMEADMPTAPERAMDDEMQANMQAKFNELATQIHDEAEAWIEYTTGHQLKFEAVDPKLPINFGQTLVKMRTALEILQRLRKHTVVIAPS